MTLTLGQVFATFLQHPTASYY